MAPRETEVDLLNRLSSENLNRVIYKHCEIFLGLAVETVERMRQQGRKLFLLIHFDGFNTLAHAAAANTAQELQVLMDSQRITCHSLPVTEEVINRVDSEAIRAKLAAMTTESMFAVFEAVIHFPSGEQNLAVSTTTFTPYLINRY